jgi:hypothetical protein
MFSMHLPASLSQQEITQRHTAYLRKKIIDIALCVRFQSTSQLHARQTVPFLALELASSSFSTGLVDDLFRILEPFAIACKRSEHDFLGN